MGVAFNVSVTLTEMNCGSCGGIYALNELYRKQRQDQGGSWHCPYCQTSWNYTENELDRLRKRVEQETKKREWAETEARQQRASAEAAEKKLGHLKRRVNAGVCPHCHRTVKQMARHIETKHPNEKAA